MITELKIRNFKAIRDCELKLNPVNVFIGNNGSGKSSVIEALSFLQTLARENLQAAFNRWHGASNIICKRGGKEDKIMTEPEKYGAKAINYNEPALEFHYTQEFQAQDVNTLQPYCEETRYHSLIANSNRRYTFIKEEKSSSPKHILNSEYIIGNKNTQLRCDKLLNVYSRNVYHGVNDYVGTINPLQSILYGDETVLNWKFINFNSLIMGEPSSIAESGEVNTLKPDGSDLASYLLKIYNKDKNSFRSFSYTLKETILPYAQNLGFVKNTIKGEVFFKMRENNFILPGWMLSGGTLRILALLAVLNNPTPPPLICIEELENGLDPRMIHLIVSQIQDYIRDGGQVIITTHSPFLLSLFDLSHIIVADRTNKGEVEFFRPENNPELEKWSTRFTIDRLFTMGKLTERQK